MLAVVWILLRPLLAALGIALTGCGMLIGFFAAMARIDSSSELDYILQLDIAVGGMLAVGVALISIPATLRFRVNRWWWVRIAVPVLTWTLVSSVLVFAHQEQVRIRSSPPPS